MSQLHQGPVRKVHMIGPKVLELARGEPPEDVAVDEVCIKVSASGLGLTQLHILEGVTHRGPLPRILGHEIVGHIAAIGSRVSGFNIGDYVLVDPIVGCGGCSHCRRGDDNLCQKARHLGMKVDGGWTDLFNVRASHVFHLPADMPPEVAVMTASALPTATHAVRRGRVSPGDCVVVFGLGSVGGLLTQTARAFGATRVVGVDVKRPEEFVNGFPGCDAYVQVGVGTPEQQRRKVLDAVGRPDGADVVFEASGKPEALKHAMKVVRPAGVLVGLGVVVGGFAFEFPDYIDDFIAREVTIVSSRSFAPRDFPLAIELASARRVDVSNLLGRTIEFEKIPEVVKELLETGTGGKRMIVKL